MDRIDDLLAEKFTCPRCRTQQGRSPRQARWDARDATANEPELAHVERLAMSGTGISRFLEIQAYRYAFVSCPTCGYTEVYNLDILEGQDDLGTLFEVIFAD